VQQVFEELSRLSGLPVAEIGPDSDLYADLGLDSLEAIELLLFIESQLGVAISDDRADGIRLVREVLHELESCRTPNSGEIRDRLVSTRPYAQRSPLDRALLGMSHAGVRQLFGAYFGLRVEGGDGIPAGQPYIVAANHSSHLDMGAILAAIRAALGPQEARRLHVLGAQDYFFDKPAKSWFFSTLFNVVPIRRDQTGLAGLRMARAILASGEPVLIFPEATRTRSGQMQEFKPGLGLLAFEANVPIVPAHILGTYQALPKGKLVPARHAVRVAFAPTVGMERYREDGSRAIPRDELYRRISLDVRSAIERVGSGPTEPMLATPPAGGVATHSA
jgi:long-chain acyl-CoA synthetase